MRRENLARQPPTWLWTSPELGMSQPTGSTRRDESTFGSGYPIALRPIAVNVTTSTHDDSSDRRSEKSKISKSSVRY